MSEPVQDSENPDVPTGFYDEDDTPFSLRDYGPEDYVVFVIFWLLAGVVFIQFFTRYVLNDSIGWTEEVARYLLICVCFIGSAIAVRKNSHIMVEFFYRWIPRMPARLLSTLVDLLRIVFFGWGTWLAWLVFNLLKNRRMTALDVSMGIIYAVVVLGFALMTLRSIQVAWRHWRQGHSNLDHPIGRQVD